MTASLATAAARSMGKASKTIKGPQIVVSRVGLECVSHETCGFLSIAKLRSFPKLQTPWLPRTLAVEVLI